MIVPEADRAAGTAFPAIGGGPPEIGVYLVDKPPGPTSFRIVQQVRRALGIKKVGHAGTLDPFASGLLIIAAGRPATKLIGGLMAGEKEYEAVLRLGIETDTHDPEGRVIAERPLTDITPKRIEACLAGLRGEQLQAPPAYSAVKHEGRPLYYYARKGIAVSKEPRRVFIRELASGGLDNDRLAIRVCCSKGTYIRTLAADIGRCLDCGAHLASLRRLRSGPFSVTNALPGAELQDSGPARALLLHHRMTVNEVVHKIEKSKENKAERHRAGNERQGRNESTTVRR
jgi:tRNA pseudouridine55 synthase